LPQQSRRREGGGFSFCFFNTLDLKFSEILNEATT
jgi:hypothetical protein